jgi:hemolysin activation/secretion protein
MAGNPGCVLSRLGAGALVALVAGTCVPASIAQINAAEAAQTRQPGQRPDQPPPGQPAVANPGSATGEFIPPQPNRGEDAAARAARPADSERPSYLVGAFVLKYALDHPSLPSIDDLQKVEVTLGRTEEGYVAPGGGVPEETVTIEDVALQPPTRWTSRAIYEVSKAIVAEMNRLGVIAIRVAPDQAEFAPPGEGDPEWGKDLRKPGQSAVTLIIRAGLVTEMRTIAFGERIPTERRINAEEHRRILEGVPVQPYHPDDPERRDVLRKDELDEYVYRLNRHPGRRVDLAIAPGAATGQAGDEAISLDLLINENRPWLAYFQVSNTGTKSTNEWRERFGYVNNQLTGDDDILSLDYITAGFDESHAVVASYSRPIWEDWLRGRVFASWNQFTASEVGFSDEKFKGEGYQVGAELIANVFQRRELFIDAFGAVRFQHLKVNQELVGIKGDDDFFLPSVGLRLERQAETSTTTAQVSLEWNLSDVANTDKRSSERLGRLDVDTDWTTFQWDLSHSFFLDPLVFGQSWFDTSPAGHATLAHEIGLGFRGQFAFDNRLIPNEEQVLGGLYTVRGYPESVVAGDTVYVGTAEYRFHLPAALGMADGPGELFGKPFRSRPTQPYGRADWDLILRAFVDAGRVENSSRKVYERDETLVGAGVGAELQFRQWLNLRVDWGFALDALPANGAQRKVDSGDNRVHFVGTILF